MIRGEHNGFLAPHSTISFSIEFSAPVAGSFHEEYTFTFDQNIPEVRQ